MDICEQTVLTVQVACCDNPSPIADTQGSYYADPDSVIETLRCANCGRLLSGTILDEELPF